ncbi:hypothetical protein RUND412_007303, partial [Rhizina undulata]
NDPSVGEIIKATFRNALSQLLSVRYLPLNPYTIYDPLKSLNDSLFASASTTSTALTNAKASASTITESKSEQSSWATPARNTSRMAVPHQADIWESCLTTTRAAAQQTLADKQFTTEYNRPIQSSKTTIGKIIGDSSHRRAEESRNYENERN